MLILFYVFIGKSSARRTRKSSDLLDQLPLAERAREKEREIEKVILGKIMEKEIVDDKRKERSRSSKQSKHESSSNSSMSSSHHTNSHSSGSSSSRSHKQSQSHQRKKKGRYILFHFFKIYL